MGRKYLGLETRQTRLEPRVQTTKPCFVVWTPFMVVAPHGVEFIVAVRLDVVEDEG
jgi:hypothetical protein